MKNHYYLRSGMLESYLLGLTTQPERAEVEQLLNTDQEVLDQLDVIESEMEQYFLRNAVPPPPSVRNAVLERIGRDEIQKWQPPTQTEQPWEKTRTQSAQPHYTDVSVSDTHIQVHKNWRTAFIAVFVLSKIFLIAGLYYYFKANSLEQEIQRLKTPVQQTVTAPAPHLQ